MQVTFTVDLADPHAIQQAYNTFTKLAGAVTGKDVPAAPAASTKASAKKTDAPPAEKPAEAAKAPPAPEPDPLDDAPAAPPIDRETVRAALKAVQALDGKDAAVALLKKYGANSMSELKDEHFANALADAKANPKVKAAG